jgi:hypothetical protein
MRFAICALSALAALTMAHQHACAGTETGIITQITTRDSDGLIYLELSGTPTDRPSCASLHPYWSIPNETTVTGKAMYAMLLAARMAGSPVVIVGKNTCSARLGTSEDIALVSLQ